MVETEHQRRLGLPGIVSVLRAFTGTLPRLPTDKGFIPSWKVLGWTQGGTKAVGEEGGRGAGTQVRPVLCPVVPLVDGDCLAVSLPYGAPGGSGPATRSDGHYGHQQGAGPGTADILPAHLAILERQPRATRLIFLRVSTGQETAGRILCGLPAMSHKASSCPARPVAGREPDVSSSQSSARFRPMLLACATTQQPPWGSPCPGLCLCVSKAAVSAPGPEGADGCLALDSVLALGCSSS